MATVNIDGNHYDLVRPPYTPEETVLVIAYDESDPRIEKGIDAPAWYNGRTGDAMIIVPRTKLEGVKAEKATRVLNGLVSHELAHARWSRWLHTSPALHRKSSKVLRTLALFEESRIEQRAVNSAGYVRPFLRSAVEHLILGTVDEIAPSRASVAHAWGLLRGRMHAGIITEEEFQPLDIAARIALDDDTVDYLDELLSEAIWCSTESEGHVDLLVSIAEAWIEAVGVDESAGIDITAPLDAPDEVSDEDEEGESADATIAVSKGDDDEDDEDEDDEDESDAPSGASDEDEDESDDGEDGDESDAPGDDDETNDDDSNDDDQRGTGSHEDTGDDEEHLSDEVIEEVKRAIEDVLEDVTTHPGRTNVSAMADAQETAHKVFSKQRGVNHLDKKPSTALRNAAGKTARRLEALAAPAIMKKSVAKKTPPGRLKSREAVRASAERSRGMMQTAQPWRATKRTHTHAPPITVGVMTDVSGSMHWAQTMVGEVAYIFSNAGSMIGARTAAVTFGDNTQRVVAPGERLNTVPICLSNGKAETANTAFAALDGILHLTDGPLGTKILVVVSDGVFVRTAEMDGAKAWVPTLLDAGVTIIWVDRGRPHPNFRDKRIVQVNINEGGGAEEVTSQIMTAIEKSVGALTR
jgi:hypothetical protein